MAENLGTETMLISQNQFLFFFLVQSFVLVLVLHCSSAIKTFYISFSTAVTVYQHSTQNREDRGVE